MAEVATLEEGFRTRWPNLWSLLNSKAHQTLPTGLREYLSGDWAATGADQLDRIDALAAEIIALLGYRSVGDVYRSDLSGYTTEQQVAEFACELSVCAALSRIAKGATLRPPIVGQEKRPDVKVAILGHEIFGEVKRYRDDGPTPSGRSIGLREQQPAAQAAARPSRPRMMALVSKLRGVPDQLPDATINILFVFHPGYGENQRYIQQALFGDASFLDDPRAIAIGRDGLFAEEGWSKVSAVAYVVDCAGVLHCQELWRNPKASVALPAAVQSVIQGLA